MTRAGTPTVAELMALLAANAAEKRDIRVFATGRKSWLFSDTVDGARASAIVYSLTLTCRACGIEPLAYLRHVLAELPYASEEGRLAKK